MLVTACVQELCHDALIVAFGLFLGGPFKSGVTPILCHDFNIMAWK